jgi:hypothetical protein
MPWRVRSNRGCNHWSDEPCERCEAQAPWTPQSGSGPRVHVFYEGVYEHMQGPLERPVEITSPDQLRREAQARGLHSPNLDDGMSAWRRRNSGRWI